MGTVRTSQGLRLLAALLALALLWLPALPPAPRMAAPATPAMADCAGHAAATPSHHHQAPAETPDQAHPACCILGQCPMLAALLPPQPRALPGPGIALAPESPDGTDPAGVLRGPPRPPPRAPGLTPPPGTSGGSSPHLRHALTGTPGSQDIRPMHHRLPGLALAACLTLALTPPARATIEEGYVPGGTPVPTTWYRWADPAALAADRDYVRGMRQHHAGALTMSEAYLAEPAARSPALRRLAVAIIRNQRFEIALLDEVGRNLDRPPLRLGGLALQPMATEGLAQMAQFQRSPIPGAGAPGPVSEADVRLRQGDDPAPPGRARHGAGLPGGLRHGAGGQWLPRPGERRHRHRPDAGDRADAAGHRRLARRCRAVAVPPGMVHGMPGMAAGPSSPGHHHH